VEVEFVYDRTDAYGTGTIQDIVRLFFHHLGNDKHGK
jgi:hypothetical protein